MGKTLKIILLSILFFAFVLTVFFVFFGKDQSLSEIQEKKTIRIGYSVEAPFAFLKSENEVTGQSPELAKYIVKQIGIERIEWRQVEFSALFSELQAERIDVIAAGTFITRERAERANFSEPIFRVRQSLLVLRGNPRKIISYRDFIDSSDLRVAVLSGSVEEIFFRNAGMSENRLIVVPDALTGRVAVEAGNSDALALSSPTIQWMALKQQLGKTEMAQTFEQNTPASNEFSGYGAFAFRKDDIQLLNEWNAALKDFLQTEDYKKMIAEFGFTELELPGNITTAEVLKK